MERGQCIRSRPFVTFECISDIMVNINTGGDNFQVHVFSGAAEREHGVHVPSDGH